MPTGASDRSPRRPTRPPVSGVRGMGTRRGDDVWTRTGRILATAQLPLAVLGLVTRGRSRPLEIGLAIAVKLLSGEIERKPSRNSVQDIS